MKQYLVLLDDLRDNARDRDGILSSRATGRTRLKRGIDEHDLCFREQSDSAVENSKDQRASEPQDPHRKRAMNDQRK